LQPEQGKGKKREGNLCQGPQAARISVRKQVRRRPTGRSQLQYRDQVVPQKREVEKRGGQKIVVKDAAMHSQPDRTQKGLSHTLAQVEVKKGEQYPSRTVSWQERVSGGRKKNKDKKMKRRVKTTEEKAVFRDDEGCLAIRMSVNRSGKTKRPQSAGTSGKEGKSLFDQKT